MTQWTVPWQQVADKVKLNVETVVQKTTFDLFSKVLERSPVGNSEKWAVNISRASRGLGPVPKDYVGGRFRANWNCNFNSIDESTIDSTDQTRGANEATKALSIPAGGVVYFSNSLPYANRLEYDAWSKQSPAGMVRISAAEFSLYFDKALKS